MPSSPHASSDLATADPVAAVRAFNRFWTARIGVLDATLLETPYSLTQARILYELAQVDRLDVATLRRTLAVDAGYLSRLLKGHAARGLIDLVPAAADRRRRVATLTPTGRSAAADLDRRSADQVRAMLEGITSSDVGRLADAMSVIRRTLEPLLEPRPTVTSSDIEPSPPSSFHLPPPPPRLSLRALRPGDLGWVVTRHGAVYAQEYGWDMSFEALVAKIVADFASDHDPTRERAWIADVDGAPAGCIFCVRATDGAPGTAQLRLLLVEASARGLGVGSALVSACLAFARAAGYRRIVLWTNDVLIAARRIYEREGFTLISQEPHTSFDHALVGQYWGRDL